MSRASVADASAQAEVGLNFAFVRRSLGDLAGAMAKTGTHIRRLELLRLDRHRFRLRKRDLALFLHLCVPLALLAFIGGLVALSIIFISREQDRVVTSATTDIELIASVIADDISLRLRDEPRSSPALALSRALAVHLPGNGRRVLVSDIAGNVVASFPERPRGGPLADHLGAAQAVTFFAEKAGVMRLVLPGGAEALATVHTLRAPLGQVTVVQPMIDVLGDWYAMVWRVFGVVAVVVIVMLALAVAYVQQAARARHADRFCHRMRERVDLVLTRGRCGLWDWDLIGGTIDWSASMYEMIGVPPRDHGMSFAEIDAMIHPADGGLDALTRALSQSGTSTVDHVFRIRNRGGGWVWLRAKAEIVRGTGGSPHLVGIAVDVTETMALEERTAKADMRLRDAIETISEAFVVWDAENKLVMCNSKFQRFHNLPSDAVAIGTPYAEVMACGTAPVIQSQVALGEVQPMGARTFEARLADGRWLQVNERRTKDGGYVSVGTDITALKRNEEQLLESEGRLMSTVVDLRKSRQEVETHAQKLAELADKYLEQKAEAENANRAKSEFLANMGHELRTPLNAILGFSEIMMLESYGELGSPFYQEYCKDIHTSGQYLLGVIADVLEMSRLEAGRVRLERADFAIGGAIEAAVSTVSDIAAENEIEIVRDATNEAKLYADRAAIEKILAILLNNAVKFTPTEGKVTVRTRSVQGAMNIYIEDTGVGIPPEALERLGRPFEQSSQGLKNGMRGSGLGLAIARSLVELHGGSLRIRSQPDIGTVVMMHLPNRPVLPRPKLELAASANTTITGTTRSVRQLAATTASKMSRTA